jgi:hypothetical protein
MTDNKGGPVKPPVIDLSAREGAAKPEAAKSQKSGPTQAKEPETAKPQEKAAEPPKSVVAPPPVAESGGNSGAIALGVVGGGVLGLAAAYALAWAGLWPAPPMEPRLAELTPSLPQIGQLIPGVPHMHTAMAETAGKSPDAGAAAMMLAGTPTAGVSWAAPRSTHSHRSRNEQANVHEPETRADRTCLR